MLFKPRAVKNLLESKLPEDEECLLSGSSLKETKIHSFFGKDDKTPKKYSHVTVEEISISEKLFLDDLKKSNRTSFADKILWGLACWFLLLCVIIGPLPRVTIVMIDSSGNMADKVQNFKTPWAQNALADQAVSPSDNLAATTESSEIMDQDETENGNMVLFTPIKSEAEVSMAQQWITSPAEMNSLSVIFILILVTAFYLADYLGYY